MTESCKQWDEHEGSFDTAKYTTIGLYTVGAGLLVTGYLMRRSSGTESAPAVSAMPTEGGAFVTVGWRR
jgi:hypothetical protein